MWPDYRFQVPEQKRLRYIIHTDCKNEADDQFTVAHILMTDKLAVEGIIAGHFELNYGRYPEGESVKASYEEIEKITRLMHLEGQYPVLMGADSPMQDEHTPVDSEGARFIIEQALKDDPRPLYIGFQGAITDLASAILMEPKICDRIIAIWIGGGDYPDGGQEFNLLQDIHAANVVFRSGIQLWQVPISTYKQFSVSLAELQIKVAPYGQIGRYLFEQMAEFNLKTADQSHWPHCEIWGLGDEGTIAALMSETEKTNNYEMVDAPLVAPDLHYIHGVNPNKRKVRVYKSLDARSDLEDLFAKLKINFPEQDS